MFTGIVSDIGTVVSISAPEPDLRRIRIACGRGTSGLVVQ